MVYGRATKLALTGTSISSLEKSNLHIENHSVNMISTTCSAYIFGLYSTHIFTLYSAYNTIKHVAHIIAQFSTYACLSRCTDCNRANNMMDKNAYDPRDARDSCDARTALDMAGNKACGT